MPLLHLKLVSGWWWGLIFFLLYHVRKYLMLPVALSKLKYHNVLNIIIFMCIVPTTGMIITNQ